jgi:hypothetical protein
LFVEHQLVSLVEVDFEWELSRAVETVPVSLEEAHL